MLWTIDGTPHRILGSIHFYPQDGDLPAWVHDAYRGVRRVYFEADPTPTETLEMIGVDRKGAHLRLPGTQRTYDRAARILASIGHKHQFDALRPWRASMMLGVLLMVAAHGLSSEAGVDSTLMRLVVQDALECSYLERPGRAFEIFESTVEADGGIGLLEEIVRDRDRPVREFARILTAWKSSDLDELSSVEGERIAQFPRIFEPLFRGRNREWIPEILRAIESDTPTLFVMGALHLVGDQSVIRLLGDSDVATTFKISNG